MSELAGSLTFATALLAWVTWDLLRAHGRIVRGLEALDPTEPSGSAAPSGGAGR